MTNPTASKPGIAPQTKTGPTAGPSVPPPLVNPLLKDPIATPLGVCIFPEPAPNGARTASYTQYLHEVLHHAGLCYTTFDYDELPQQLPNMSVLLTVGESALDEKTRTQMADWVAQGGQWITVAGVCGLENVVGVAPQEPAYSSFGGGLGTLGEGYLQPIAEHPLTAALPIPLHFFNGMPAHATTAQVLATVLDAHQRPSERVALAQNSHGRGRVLFLAPDLPGTIVRIQHGTGVLRDGISAPDGTAAQADSVLKSSDGAVLDWHFDRQPVPDVPELHAFLQPVADLWKDLLLRALFDALTATQSCVPVLWYYPRNLPGLAHLSHDTDQNDPACAERMLEVVAEAGIHSTWCVILPGYPPALIQRILDEGHELAMHYDSMTEGLEWGANQFHHQWEELVAMFRNQRPISNKNHYLRWEGDSELFEWCAIHGIQLDQTKGASKTGEAGYIFGTCHLYQPVDFAGQTFDLLEMPTPTQDFIIFAPPAILEPMLDAVQRVHGILHLLFHPSHILKPGVADSILNAVAAAKAAGLEWWRADEINAWERTRRALRWNSYQSNNNGATTVEVISADGLHGATFLWPGENLHITSTPPTGEAHTLATMQVERWGQVFQAVTLDLAPNEPVTLQVIDTQKTG